MKITIERDDGETEVFQRVTDLYIAYRHRDLKYNKSERTIQEIGTETRSHSWGNNVRELVKEIQQSLVELQEFLKEQRHGGSK